MFLMEITISKDIDLCVLGKKLDKEGRAEGTNGLLLISYGCLGPRKVLGDQNSMNEIYGIGILLC